MTLHIHVGVKYLRSVNKIEMDADAAVAGNMLGGVHQDDVGWRPPSDSISLVVLGSTDQAGQALMSETACQKVTWFPRKTISTIWDFGSGNSELHKLPVILDGAKSLLFDSVHI